MKTNRKQRGDAVKFLLFISLTDNCRFFPMAAKDTAKSLARR
jgi:hypothetical protein